MEVSLQLSFCCVLFTLLLSLLEIFPSNAHVCPILLLVQTCSFLYLQGDTFLSNVGSGEYCSLGGEREWEKDVQKEVTEGNHFILYLSYSLPSYLLLAEKKKLLLMPEFTFYSSHG
jgi:hypothetical protein